jgi:muconolactone delta-isomerase
MKFLVLVKSRVGVPAPENPVALYKAAREAIETALADGSLDCAYQFAHPGRSVSINNADSAEELWERIAAYPLAPFLEFEVHPLADVMYVFDKSIERMEKMAGE